MTTNAWRRSFGLLLPLALLLGIFCLPASAAGSRHPYFNDRGTLSWHHSLARAQMSARRLNKVIFIEYGRQKCSNCKKLAQNVLPHRSLRSRMSNAAVGLAAECDRPERAVYQLFKTHLAGARVLPFAAFITPDGQWITGWYGAQSVRQVSAHLSMAESHVRAMRGTVVHRPAPRTVRRPAAPDRRPAASPPPTVRRAYPAPPPPPSVLRENGIAPSPQPAPGAVAEEDVDDGCNDPCAGAECVGGNCKPPSLECKPLIDLPRLPNPFELLTRNCKPKPCPPKACPPCPPQPTSAPQPVRPPQPTVAAKTSGFGDFPPPQPRVKGPERHLAEVDSPDGPMRTARRNEKVPVAPAAAASAGAVKSVLPAPVVKRTLPGASLPPIGDGPTAKFPDSKIPSCDPTPNVADRAKDAAARGDWAAVLLLTRKAKPEQKYLIALNREAHAWAHSRLAYAVAEVRKGRFVEARNAVAEVKLAMRGEAESVDAERGVEAIELMRDLDFLAAKSPVRTTVRKTAYEKMRGTRWAALFSDGAQPSVALSSR